MFKALLAGLVFLSACQNPDPTPQASSSPAFQQETQLHLPEGFQAQIFADQVGAVRHLAVRENGDVYIHLSGPQQGKCLVAMRDADQNGSAEIRSYFGDSQCGTGLAIDTQFLYYGEAERIMRLALPPKETLVPNTAAEVLVTQLGKERGHNARSLALDGQGHLYVNIGAPSNACQQQDRKRGSKGQDPCPWLNTHAGIYRFRTDRLSQEKPVSGVRYATGIRNAVAIDWYQDKLYVVQHGRDQLSELYPQLYNATQNAELPAEEFAVLNEGDDLGWPYCYYDPLQKVKVLAPEYGGDGKRIERCTNKKAPLIGFPAHYAPNDLIFYTGKQFPAEYQGAALIAFHGSWNRAPLPQAGYQVAMVPAGKTQWKTFIEGFQAKGKESYRPMGLAQLPDGALLVADSQVGRIWKITYEPTKE